MAELSTPCVLSTTVNSAGYGHHRDRWVAANGPVPRGHVLDHPCGNKPCVNLDHLEPVTQSVNLQRASALKTHCKRGHPRTPENTYIRRDSPPGTTWRQCRACTREDQRVRRAA